MFKLGYTYSTIEQYLSNIQRKLRLLNKYALDDSYPIKHLMLGIKCYWDKGYAKRPLSICMLSNITCSLLFSQKIKYYVQILASTMLNISFHALLRVGEYTAPTAIADSKILVTGVTVYRDQIWLKIMSPKMAKDSFQTAVKCLYYTILTNY